MVSSFKMDNQPPPSQQSKHDVKIAPGAIVCSESKLRGDITIGSKTIVHPKATILAEAGPIVIGEGNVIEDQALIINRIPKGQDGSDNPQTLTIGMNNVFEVDCHFESMRMGHNNVLESKSYIGPGVEVTNGCTIGAGCRLTGTEVLPENVVIYGSECTRRIAIDKPQPPGLQVDYLSRVLPSYHHLKKGKKA